MSCFLLPNYALSVIGQEFVEHCLTGVHKKDKKTPAQVAKIFWEMNIAAMRERYGDNAVILNNLPVKFRFDPRARAGAHTPVELLKCANCYSYQCLDSSTWEGSTAQNWIQELKEEMIRQLPGYAQAPWGTLEAPRMKNRVG